MIMRAARTLLQIFDVRTRTAEKIVFSLFRFRNDSFARHLLDASLREIKKPRKRGHRNVRIGHILDTLPVKFIISQNIE